MLRYGIFPVTGSGTFADPYRATAASVPGVNINEIIPGNPDGTPKYHFVICALTAVNWTSVLSLTNSYLFPVFSLDSQMGTMDAATRSAMNQSVAAYDLDGNGKHINMGSYVDTDSFRTLLQSILDTFETGHRVDVFTAAEPTQ